MKKQIFRILSALLAVCWMLSAAGCLVQDDTVATDPDPTGIETEYTVHRDAVAVTLGEIEITAGEIEDNYNSYMQMLSYYGMSAPTDDASINEYVQMIVEDLITQQLPIWKAAQQGITLTDAELAEIDANAHYDADAEYTDLVLSYASYFTDAGDVESVADLTEAQLTETLEYLNADVQEYYGDPNADLDVYLSDAYDHSYLDYLINAYAEKLQAQSEAAVTVDAETVEVWYENALAEQKALFDTDATYYRDQRDALTLDPDEEPLLYVPEGLAVIRLIALAPEAEAPKTFAENEAKLAELEAEYGKLALNGGDEARMAEIEAEYAALSAENKAIRNEYFGSVIEKAQALYARLEAGEDFASLTEASDEQLICYTDTDYEIAEIVQNAVSAMADGTYSEVLSDGDTYYIVYLVGKLAAGPVDREPIAAAIEAAAAAEAREAAWEELVAAWQEEAYAAAVYHRDAYAYVGR